MKKTLLLLSAIVSLLAYQASAQTISVTGSSGSIDLTSGGPFTFDSTITLTTSGPPPSNIQTVNLQLRTPGSGPDSGASLFTVQIVQIISPFTTANGPSTPATFTRPGEGPNTGFLLSNTEDLGANMPAANAVDNSSGVMSLGVVVLRFSLIDPNATPLGEYRFSATLGDYVDDFGTTVQGTDSVHHSLTANPEFTVAVVPEPSTWALIAVGGMASFGITMLRRRKS